MYPRETVMDMVSFDFHHFHTMPFLTTTVQSLAIVLYFASKGTGLIRSSLDPEGTPYTTPARVLLSGLGADELLGGYGRHRTTFQHRSWAGLVEEVRRFYPSARFSSQHLCSSCKPRSTGFRKEIWDETTE
jgi:asparagine synthetase B (glutamine-hydrolysing)